MEVFVMEGKIPESSLDSGKLVVQSDNDESDEPKTLEQAVGKFADVLGKLIECDENFRNVVSGINSSANPKDNIEIISNAIIQNGLDGQISESYKSSCYEFLCKISDIALNNLEHEHNIKEYFIETNTDMTECSNIIKSEVNVALNELKDQYNRDDLAYQIKLNFNDVAKKMQPPKPEKDYSELINKTRKEMEDNINGFIKVAFARKPLYLDLSKAVINVKYGSNSKKHVDENNKVSIVRKNSVAKFVGVLLVNFVLDLILVRVIYRIVCNFNDYRKTEDKDQRSLAKWRLVFLFFDLLICPSVILLICSLVFSLSNVLSLMSFCVACSLIVMNIYGGIIEYNRCRSMQSQEQQIKVKEQSEELVPKKQLNIELCECIEVMTENYDLLEVYAKNQMKRFENTANQLQKSKGKSFPKMKYDDYFPPLVEFVFDDQKMPDDNNKEL